ncbi:hypothetical protein AB0N62_40705 [Streptomyces sp. NPDC093982]|uniref:hypothetical protein n=1 Tax=Streptomyces sp. NPDC093982 TaxID=3155077 RepID=UPI003417B49C
MCEEFGNICRVVWNTGLDQRRQYRRRGVWMSYVPPGRRVDRGQARPLVVESGAFPRASADVEGSRPGLPGPRNVSGEVALEDALGTLVPFPRREPHHRGNVSAVSGGVRSCPSWAGSPSAGHAHPAPGYGPRPSAARAATGSYRSSSTTRPPRPHSTPCRTRR